MQNTTQNVQKSQIKVGIVRPISVKDPYKQGHWGYIHRAIEEALTNCEEYEFMVSLVSENTKSDIIQSTIIKNLYHADVIVCDLSSLNPNVFFELGIRMAYRKPCVLLIDDKTSPPFDVAPIRYIDYPSSFHRYELEEKQKEIRKTVIEVHKLYTNQNQVAYSPFFTEVNIKESATLEQKDVTALEALTKKVDILISQQESKTIDEQRSLSITNLKNRIRDEINSLFSSVDHSLPREVFIEQGKEIVRKHMSISLIPRHMRNVIMDECVSQYINPYAEFFSG